MADRTDEIVEQILTSYDTITVVGASDVESKAAHYVPAHMHDHGWRIVAVNPRGGHVLGQPAHRSLDDVPRPVGLVNVFRPSPETPAVARRAVAVGATALWLQLGIASKEARAVADAPVANHHRPVPTIPRGTAAQGALPRGAVGIPTAATRALSRSHLRRLGNHQGAPERPVTGPPRVGAPAG